MLRAGPFSDERVIRRINRRFVPHYFDLSPAGAAKDADARRMVLAAKPELGRQSVTTPPVLLLTPQGELLAEVSNYASETDLLASLDDVLAAHGDWDVATAEEELVLEGGAPLARAELLFDLGRLDDARKALEKAPGSAEALLSTRLSRLQGDLAAAIAAVARVTDAAFADAARVERAWLALRQRDFKTARTEAAAVAASSASSDEAAYVEGLASFHDGKVEAAQKRWKVLVTKAKTRDRWICRADWAYTQSLQPKGAGTQPGTSFSTGGARQSLLDRIGYMGRENPDLEPIR